MRFKAPKPATVLVVSVVLGMIFFGHSHFGKGLYTFSSETSTAPFTDHGLFVVMNSFPSNGTSAPLPLRAGDWGDSLVFSRPVALVNFALYNGSSTSGTLLFSVNATIPQPLTVNLDMETSTLPSQFFLSVSRSA